MSAIAVPRGLPRLLLALVVALFALLAPAGAAAGAPAATRAGTTAAAGLDTVAEALRKNPVYVDPAASAQLPPADAEALAKKIKDADKPVFVAVLPAAPEYPRSTVLRDLRTKVGLAGVYAVHLGDGFNAAADRSVMSRNAVANLVGSVQRSGGDTASQVNAFVDQAGRISRGHAPGSWGGDTGEGVGATGLITGGAVLVAGGAGAYAVYRRARRKREERERAELDALRVVVDEDITAFGEELDRLDFSPSEAGATDEMRTDYERALDSYEEAKTKIAAAARPEDVRGVTEALDNGRFALATLAARRAGTPLPERRLPCFFDPRHGPSVKDVEWAPPGGAPRTVPACAADAARLADGQEPMSRQVQTAYGPQPYWNAGPAYAPWAGGYFGGGLLPGLLVGTLLGGMMYGPAYGASSETAGPDGGDYTGSDYNPDDFGGGGWGDGGGGFGDGGGGGGGDFGGGGW
ncbi:hypothetical protein [Streptomyces griseocarneus]|uniref:hypothetical protein n=1 Tax=Streptomyces griseocarneus TaxID=51201 RepID=UPI00167C88CE|nr:hypothetical protein [Streptomyces griseocarneus]MBZ6473420.1 hypothetical protein [Streptomyces griseocarneus]GHG56984.1 hypothetical protein GCM10018779_21720 [Streptomyces griseocarneus]